MQDESIDDIIRSNFCIV